MFWINHQLMGKDLNIFRLTRENVLNSSPDDGRKIGTFSNCPESVPLEGMSWTHRQLTGKRSEHFLTDQRDIFWLTRESAVWWIVLNRSPADGKRWEHNLIAQGERYLKDCSEPIISWCETVAIYFASAVWVTFEECPESITSWWGETHAVFCETASETLNQLCFFAFL